MSLEDWHTHNQLCRHAVGTSEDYVKKAIEKKLDTLGISDHFPYGYLTQSIPSINQIPYQEYSMQIEEVDSYIEEIKMLKELYGSEINIRSAFEIDFFQNQEILLNKSLDPYIDDLDYIIGSIHVLFSEKGIFAFDDRRFIDKYEQFNSIDKIYLLYYKTLKEMIQSECFHFDIIGHFDLPKKFNKVPEDKKKVMEVAIDVLNAVKENDITVEINTSGLRKDVKEQYPSMDLIEVMCELDIPIVLGSDAHHPDEISHEFSNIIKKLKEIGYSQLAHFKNRKRTCIEI